MSLTTPPASLIFALLALSAPSPKKDSGDALCDSGHKACFYDEGQLGEHAVAEHLSVAKPQGVDDGDDAGVSGDTLLLLCGDEAPELVDVDDGPPVGVAGQVEVAHTDFTEVTGMVLVEVCSARVRDMEKG